jgi:hypothetical protein
LALHVRPARYQPGVAPLHGFFGSTPQQSVLATCRIQIDNVVQHEGGTLSPRELEGKYKAALSRIAGAQTSGNAKRHTPIFQREPAISEKQAIQDAANALAAIWKIGEPSKR